MKCSHSGKETWGFCFKCERSGGWGARRRESVLSFLLSEADKELNSQERNTEQVRGSEAEEFCDRGRKWNGFCLNLGCDICKSFKSAYQQDLQLLLKNIFILFFRNLQEIFRTQTAESIWEACALISCFSGLINTYGVPTIG